MCFLYLLVRPQTLESRHRIHRCSDSCDIDRVVCVCSRRIHGHGTHGLFDYGAGVFPRCIDGATSAREAVVLWVLCVAWPGTSGERTDRGFVADGFTWRISAAARQMGRVEDVAS